MLNGLYGYFGRNPIKLKTQFVNNEELIYISKYHSIFQIVTLKKNYYLIKYNPN
jgi:hypothetical protein